MLTLTCESGKCYIGVGSYDEPRQAKMKYSWALAALQGVWDLTYLGKREFSARFTLQYEGIGIGHGKLTTGTLPHVAVE